MTAGGTGTSARRAYAASFFAFGVALAVLPFPDCTTVVYSVAGTTARRPPLTASRITGCLGRLRTLAFCNRVIPDDGRGVLQSARAVPHSSESRISEAAHTRSDPMPLSLMPTHAMTR